MIYTHGINQLGFPAWVLKGLIVEQIELSDNGYGLAVEYHVAAMHRRIGRVYGKTAAVLNAAWKVEPGNAHSEYKRIRFTLTGDLYHVSQRGPKEGEWQCPDCKGIWDKVEGVVDEIKKCGRCQDIDSYVKNGVIK